MTIDRSNNIKYIDIDINVNILYEIYSQQSTNQIITRYNYYFK